MKLNARISDQRWPSDKISSVWSKVSLRWISDHVWGFLINSYVRTTHALLHLDKSTRSTKCPDITRTHFVSQTFRNGRKWTTFTLNINPGNWIRNKLNFLWVFSEFDIAVLVSDSQSLIIKCISGLEFGWL